MTAQHKRVCGRIRDVPQPSMQLVPYGHEIARRRTRTEKEPGYLYVMTTQQGIRHGRTAEVPQTCNPIIARRRQPAAIIARSDSTHGGAVSCKHDRLPLAV